MSTPKGPLKDTAEVLAGLLAQAGLDLPVRLRAWDGSEAGPAEGPVLLVRSPRALQRILWRPGELGLARAYVSGDLDVEGDLTDGLRRVRANAPRPGPFGLVKTSLAAVQAVIAGHYDLPAAFSGFEVLEVEAMREHYARTIRAWLANFEASLPAITGLLSAEQVRVWRLYLAGGALAFEQGRMGVDQILARRPPR